MNSLSVKDAFVELRCSMKKACEDTFLSFPLHSSNYDAQIYLFLIISAHDNQKVI